MKGSNRLYNIVVLLIACTISVFALDGLPIVPDSSVVRLGIKSDWFLADNESLREKQAIVMENEIGQKFQVRYEESTDECEIAVIPSGIHQIISYSDAGKQVIEREAYKKGVPGTWVVFKNLLDGKPECIRYYFMPDTTVYIQFRPLVQKNAMNVRIDENKRSLADFVILGQKIVENIPIGLPIESFYTMSFKQVYKLTEKTLPWRYVTLTTGLYHTNLQLAQNIRENLDRFEYLENVAYNENGDCVLIKDNSPITNIDTELKDGKQKLYTSSLGFAKWIIDGIVKPLAGGFLYIDLLKTPTVFPKEGSLAYSISDKFNIYIALDWTRNLATAALSVQAGRDYTYESSGVNVTISPFHGVSPKFVGYQCDVLYPLMYILSAENPEWFYLGAIRYLERGESDFSVYNECVAFIPYFDDVGRFGISVFMNGKEISLDSFIKTYQDCFVNLVRVRALEKFLAQ